MRAGECPSLSVPKRLWHLPGSRPTQTHPLRKNELNSRPRNTTSSPKFINTPTSPTILHTQNPTMSPSPPSPPWSPTQENDVFGFGEEFVSAPEYKQAGTASVSFDGLLDPPLLLHEDLAEGCGGMLWPAGMRLAKYLLKARAEEMRNAESMYVVVYLSWKILDFAFGVSNC